MSQRIGPKAAIIRAMMASHFICEMGTRNQFHNAGLPMIYCQTQSG